MLLSAALLTGLMPWCSSSIRVDIFILDSSHIFLHFLFSLSSHPIAFIFSFHNPNLKLPHSFFKPLFSFKLDFHSYNMFPFTIICSNSGYCQLSKYPSPDEASFASLVTLPGFFTTTAASLLLFIMHVSSSSWLNLSCSARDYCRDGGAYAKREQQHTLTVKISLPLERN